MKERRGAEFRLESVSLRFGDVTALSGVDLRIDAGEAVAVVGPSGSGKTSLLRLLNGSARPTEGRVRIDGRPLDGLSRRELRSVRAALGFVHQEHALVPNLRVSQNVVSGRLGGWTLLGALRQVCFPSRPVLREVYEILERVGIPEKLFERTDRLSGGQRQRVAIARALFQRPLALLADEPVSSVDPARARDTIELLASICRERRLTLVTSLHNLELARACFPRLVGMRHGRVVFDSATAPVEEEALARLYALEPRELLQDGV